MANTLTDEEQKVLIKAVPRHKVRWNDAPNGYRSPEAREPAWAIVKVEVDGKMPWHAGVRYSKIWTSIREAYKKAR
jgi:hypothetical protein